MIRLTQKLGVAALATVSLVAVACSTPDSIAPKGPFGVNLDIISPPTAGNGIPSVEIFEICKVYAEGTGPNVTVDIAVDRSVGNDTTFTRTLAAGECQNIWIRGGAPDSLVATEQVPAGYDASVKVAVATDQGITSDSASGNSGGGLAGGNPRVGTTVTFINTLQPPPPGGGEGCTPGYWKAPQHHDSWTAPYTPSTLFSDVFEDAFPGMTLLQVLNQGGGGLNALGRHTVAALLNAASGGVDYDFTTTEVINAFNAVFPGGDYEGQKNIFAGFNEQGCPLN
jgi:hypothetical protein